MPNIEWTEALCIGIEVIDKQHEQLVGLFNQLYDALKARQAKDVIEGVIQELLTYAKEHFRIEEQYMRQCDFIGVNAHTIAHKKFVQEVERFHADITNGQRFVALELYQFLETWIIEHIQKSDRAYVEYLRPLIVEQTATA